MRDGIHCELGSYWHVPGGECVVLQALLRLGEWLANQISGVNEYGWV
ncbi:hypothetical protein [Rubritalea tangerina]